MQNGRIKNRAITASSFYNIWHAPYLARLRRSRSGRNVGGWVARIKNAHQWLQIFLGRPMKITGIDTQGRQDAKQWVRRYMIGFSQDNAHFEYYMQYGNYKVRWAKKRLSKPCFKSYDSELCVPQPITLIPVISLA